MGILSRRDFLKVSASLTSALFLPGMHQKSNQAGNTPNILVLVFDAMSARHLSLYGYGRHTTPSLENFASRSIVYHKHMAAGNFTTASVASMFTGQYPWKHRALNYRGLIRRTVAEQNLFRLLGSAYKRAAFTQNIFAEVLLYQVAKDLDLHLPFDSFALNTVPLLQAQDLPHDEMLAYYAVEDFLGLGIKTLNPSPGSLTLGLADILKQNLSKPPQNSADYPEGFPDNHTFVYRNEDVFRGMAEQVKELSSTGAPWMSYFHIWSPHGPYRPQSSYQGLFMDDGFEVPFHPRHKLSESHYRQKELNDFRLQYDRYVADVDANFGNMIDELEQAGALENTCVVITADHGELFERGELGHGTPLMYNPVVHIPLLISAPGQKDRRDVHTPTSLLDLLPTLLTLTGNDIPASAQGQVLPGLGGDEDEGRTIYSMVAKNNSAFRNIQQATVSQIRWPYELIYYTGYPNYPDSFELYNLVEDRFEKKDLAPIDTTLAAKLQQEFLEYFHSSIKSI